MYDGLGIVVVHLMKHVKPFLRYDHGSVEEGILRVREVLVAGTERGIPIYLATKSVENAIPGLCDGIPDFDPILLGARTNAFSYRRVRQDHRNGKLRRAILTGFDRAYCVEISSEGARKLGIPTATSDDLLFGDIEITEPEGAKDRVLRLFALRGVVYSNYREVIEQEMGSLEKAV